MRTIRGLQITSIAVLSPVLLILISLISILFISIYSYLVSIVSTQSLVRTSSDMIILQQQQQQQHHQRTFNNKQAKRFRCFPKLRPSPLTWCAIIIAYALYMLLKVNIIFAVFPNPYVVKRKFFPCWGYLSAVLKLKKICFFLKKKKRKQEIKRNKSNLYKLNPLR